MKRFEAECLYCGFRFVLNIYSKEQLKLEKCRKCGDTNLKLKEAESIDSYGDKIKKDAYIKSSE